MAWHEQEADSLLVMTPRQRVADLYERFPQPRSFEEDERLHRVTGYVIENEDVFLMGRPVRHDVPVEAIQCPHVAFAREEQDAWFIWIFAGEIKLMLELAPYPLPLVGWSRRNGRVRWYRCEDALAGGGTESDGDNCSTWERNYVLQRKNEGHMVANERTLPPCDLLTFFPIP